MKEIEITRDLRGESVRGVKRSYVISTADRCTYLILHTDGRYTIWYRKNWRKTYKLSGSKTKNFGRAIRMVADMLGVTKEEILMKLLGV